MQKQLFSLLFSMILLTVVALPTIDEVILDAFDIEIEISIDEEESKEKETKTLEFNVLLEEDYAYSNMALHVSDIHSHYQNSYSDLYLECFCPPPEYI